MSTDSYVVCLFSFKHLYLSLAEFKESGKATGKTPRPIYLLKLFTYSNSIQMSHVTEKPQKASGMLLLSKLKCNVHHRRVTRKVNENTNCAHLDQIYYSGENEENIFAYTRMFQKLLFEIIKHFWNKRVLGAIYFNLNFKCNFIVKHNKHTENEKTCKYNLKNNSNLNTV